MSGKAPYHRLYDTAGAAPEPLSFQFRQTGDEFIIAEYYCINPGCDCYNAELVFSKMHGSQIDQPGLFFIVINVKTWTVADFGALTGGLALGPYVQEFMERLPQYKERLAAHVNRARWVRHAPLHPAELAKMAGQSRGTGNTPAPSESAARLAETAVAGDMARHRCIAEFIQNSQSVGYQELVENDGNGLFIIEYDSEAWYEVDDQYCLNPQCECNESILHFIRIDRASDQAEVDFIIRQKLEAQDYEIVMPGHDQERLERVVQQFWLQCQGARKTLQERYRQMKLIGQESLQMAARVNQIATSAGRNDPCPCGSGKKFKRCCGAGL